MLISEIDYQTVRVENEVSATCTEDGYTEDKICNDCGTEILNARGKYYW